MKYKIRTFKTTYKTFSFIRLTLRCFPCSENGYLETSVFSALWISLRPISNSQLHASRHFHLCPIYLVVFKGSWDISS